MERQPTFPQWA
jgi:hypothetical protein